MKKQDRITRSERLSKIITYIESLNHAPSFSEIARDLGMHHDTVENELEFIALVQHDIRKIKILETKNSKIVVLEEPNAK